MYGPYPGIVRDWHDGDTCHVDLDLGFGIMLASYNLDGKVLYRCRIFGINAPELRTQEGKDALAYANQLCPAGTRVTVSSYHWDKYGGRFDGTITLPDGTDLGTAMIAAGHAVAYPPPKG
jgi:endonuclease YncB( thermonuclease family)